MKVCLPRLRVEAPFVSTSQPTSFCDMLDHASLLCFALLAMLAILTKPDIPLRTGLAG